MLIRRPLALLLLPSLCLAGCGRSAGYGAWPDPDSGWGVSTAGSSTARHPAPPAQPLHSPRVAVYESAEDAPPEEAGAAEDFSVTIELFYEELAPYGVWTEHATLGRVFVPHDPDYRPYRNGHWVESDEGLLWVSHDAIGWAVTHYGEWAVLDDGRWAWVPGVEWAPAWVEWQRSEETEVIGWAPQIVYGSPPIEALWVFVGVAQLFADTIASIAYAASAAPAAYASCLASPGVTAWGRRGPPGTWLRQSGLQGQRVRASRARRRTAGRSGGRVYVRGGRARGSVAVRGARGRRGGGYVYVRGSERRGARVAVRGARGVRMRGSNPGAGRRRSNPGGRDHGAAARVAERPAIDSALSGWSREPRVRRRPTVRLSTPTTTVRLPPRTNLRPQFNGPVAPAPRAAPPPARARTWSATPRPRRTRVLPPSPPPSHVRVQPRVVQPAPQPYYQPPAPQPRVVQPAPRSQPEPQRGFSSRSGSSSGGTTRRIIRTRPEVQVQRVQEPAPAAPRVRIRR